VLYQIVLDATPYPEGGGQEGTLVSATKRLRLLIQRKENNLILHFAKQLQKT
jgi:alanyl-tRNA synthetase